MPPLAPGPAPKSLPEITAQEHASALPYFSASVAWALGTALRTRLLEFPKPCVIHISTPSTPPHVLFHAVTHDGTALDNDFWVKRKRETVVRWGCSSWRMGVMFEGDEEGFAKKFGLGGDGGRYAIHGGGVPIFVKGCSTPVAVAVVSGLKQWDDHMVVIEELANVCRALEADAVAGQSAGAGAAASTGSGAVSGA